MKYDFTIGAHTFLAKYTKGYCFNSSIRRSQLNVDQFLSERPIGTNLSMEQRTM